MKKIIVLFLGLTMIFNFTNAQEKTHMFGGDPLGLLQNIYAVHYAQLINEGANEINFPFFYWKPSDELILLSAGGKYRIYKDGNGTGIFYGGGISFFKVKWEYDPKITVYDYYTGKSEKVMEEITGITYTPGVEVGYRMIWENGFTAAPSIGAGFTIGKIESHEGIEPDYGSGGFNWSLGIGFAYMW